MKMVGFAETSYLSIILRGIAYRDELLLVLTAEIRLKANLPSLRHADM